MIEFITANWADIFGIITAVIALASAVANLTPTESDNKIVAMIANIVNKLALNIKK